jgi:BA14K-like protein
MLNPLRKLALAASLGAAIASFASVASALPALDPLAIKNAVPPPIEEVQWRWGWGAPVAAGVVAGTVVGSALAGPYYGYGPYYPGPYYPGPYYPGPPPGYYGYPLPPGYAPPAPGYAAPPGASAGDPVAYCKQRYRSYNPQTGSYLGTDGQRHNCP